LSSGAELAARDPSTTKAWTLPARVAAALLILGASGVTTAFLLRDYRDGGDVQVWARHRIEGFAAESGHAFTAALPRGAPNFDGGVVTAALLEDGQPIGAAAPHDVIRQQAGGRFSFWNGTLYFSASDGSDPRNNGHRYEVAWPSMLATVEHVARTCGIGTLVLGGACSLLTLLWRRFVVQRLSVQQRRRLVAKLVLVPASLLVMLTCLELVMRWRYPFADSTWPSRFDPAFGFHFEPHATIRQTNLFGFCVEQQANSLGFLDREPERDLPTGTRRIVVLGDSFVEAVQVPIAAKSHVLLEERLRARGVPVAISAFGMSGCGTSNELAFYDHFGRSLKPDLVVVIFVSNDFANNSALLEAVRNGWHPEHLPRLFLRDDDGKTTLLPIDPAWQGQLIPTSPAPIDRPSWWLSWSRVYRWTKANVDWIGRSQVAHAYDAWSERLVWLRRQPAWEAAFAGWRWPDDDDLDVMTFALDAPPVFREANVLTERALELLRDRAAADGSRLLVVGAEHLATARSTHGRPTLPRAWLDLLEPMCKRLGLPLLDLHAAFGARGVLDKVKFARDSHWNELGHQTAAAAIDEFLQQHPDLLAGR
jgi:hypothetical protein